MVSPIQNIWTKNVETICQVILVKTIQKITVNLLMMVLIDLPIIKFTCQHHVSGYVCHVWHGLFSLLLIEIISIAKLLIIIHFLSKNTRNKHLPTFTQNLKVIKTTVFFSPIYFVGAPVFLPQHWKLLGPERLMPLKSLGMNRVKMNKVKYSDTHHKNHTNPPYRKLFPITETIPTPHIGNYFLSHRPYQPPIQEIISYHTDHTNPPYRKLFLITQRHKGMQRQSQTTSSPLTRLCRTSEDVVDQWEAQLHGTEPKAKQHRLNLGGIQGGCRGHEERGAGVEQVGGWGGGPSHVLLYVLMSQQAVVKQTQPAHAVRTTLSNQSLLLCFKLTD